MKQKEIEEMPINRDLLNLISPQHVLLKPQRAEIGDYLCKFQYIIGYPDRINLRMAYEFKGYSEYICCIGCNTDRGHSGLY